MVEAAEGEEGAQLELGVAGLQVLLVRALHAEAGRGREPGALVCGLKLLHGRAGAAKARWDWCVRAVEGAGLHARGGRRAGRRGALAGGRGDEEVPQLQVYS